MVSTSKLGTYIIAAFLQNAEPLEVPINDFLCAVEAVHFETRGEPYKGKQGITNAIQHRIDRVPKWDSFCTTIHWKGQFTYRKGTYVDLGNPIERRSFEQSVEVAYLAVQGELADVTNGADHYFNPDKVPLNKREEWMKDKYTVAVIGNHRFQRVISDTGKWMDH
jgi:spore germination cell wall hydrolase CwlJ-like protein